MRLFCWTYNPSSIYTKATFSIRLPDFRLDKEFAIVPASMTSLCSLDASDYDDILALWRRAGLPVRGEGRDAPAEFARQMASGIQRVIGIRREGQLVAVAVLTHDGRKGWINRLAVAPDFRRQGIGRRLVNEVEARLQALGLEITAALVESHNQESLRFFRAIGYEHGTDIEYVSKRRSADT
jgi:ribosomal protein S18 acetylase RimI-like enzyme